MQQEVIVYFGIDYGDIDKTIYGLYDPVVNEHKQLTEEEYNELVKEISE